MVLALLEPEDPSAVIDFAELRILISGPNSRWTEKHQLDATTPENVQPICDTIVKARAALLAYGFDLFKAIFSFNSVKGDGYVGLDFKVSGQVLADETPGPDDGAVESCNDPFVGIAMRLQAEKGHHANHLVAGVRDSWIEFESITLSKIDPDDSVIFPNPPGTYLDGQADPTYAAGPYLSNDLFQNYMSIIRDKTVLIRPDPTTPGNFRKYKFLEYSGFLVGYRQRGVVTDLPRARARTYT